MICNLFIKNFKSLKTVYLKLSNLNLLTGLNGSGKSSVIQALLLLRQSAVLCPKLILLFPWINNTDILKFAKTKKNLIIGFSFF
jgi:predicted ATPase